jgi:hypothetical protein
MKITSKITKTRGIASHSTSVTIEVENTELTTIKEALRISAGIEELEIQEEVLLLNTRKVERNIVSLPKFYVLDYKVTLKNE